MQLAQSADVVNVRMRADNGLHSQAPPAEKVQNAGDFVSRIYNQSFARQRVPDDRAIALQHANRNGDVNQPIVGSVERGQAGKAVSHEAIISLDSRATR